MRFELILYQSLNSLMLLIDLDKANYSETNAVKKKDIKAISGKVT